MIATTAVDNGNNADKGPAARTLDDGVNWRSYVEGTQARYMYRYVGFARQNTRNYSRLEEELANLMNAAQFAGIQSESGTALEMAEWLWSGGGQFLDVRGHFQEGLKLLTHAQNAARLSGDRFQEGNITGQLGRVYMALRSWQTSAEYFQQALTIARAINDRQGQASHLGNLGQIHLELAQAQLERREENQFKATDYFQDAIEIAKEIGERELEGRLLGSLGLLRLRSQMLTGYTHEGFIDAIELFENAIAIAREKDDRRGEASHLGSIGGAYELMASMSMSLPSFVRGSPYPGEDDERYERYKKGFERANRESYREAYEHYSHALDIAREIGDKKMQDGLIDSRARVAVKAGLPVYPGSGDINMNWWMRQADALEGKDVPGTRYKQRNQPPTHRKPRESG
ncbi:MAG: tetratricopeptide repeat protein [Alcaligenaceae bacterium]|nr:MAG: tetratricopeptide repeat protein [Alcaligenaceae bacterium]